MARTENKKPGRPDLWRAWPRPEVSMAEYLKVEAARELTGLRIVATAYVPGLWSEACKSLFDAKGVPYRLVEQEVGGENLALKEWTAQTSGPVAIWNDERPRSTWAEQLYLAERIGPEPRLIPEDMDDRVAMFGLCNELCGEKGFGWNLRLRMTHLGLGNPKASEMAKRIVPVLASKYHYDPAFVAPARAQQRGIVGKLRDRFRAQQERGSEYLVGDRLSALDIYWATMAGAINPLPEALCPGMPPDMRAGYTDPELFEIGGEELFAHRDRIYRQYLKLPMVF
jgi:hypothetical protein